MKYSHIVKAVYGAPWMIEASYLELILGIIDFRAEGAVLSEEEIEGRIAAAQNGPRRGPRAGVVGVIPIYGPITQRQDLMSRTSGGTSVDAITASFREAMADPDITAIVLEIDSPGGTVDGIDELTSEIRASRGTKPIVASANTMMASAAYYIASAADEITVTPTGQVGSIGVLMAHMDDTAAREKLGLKRTLISSTPEKADGWGGDPMTDEGMADAKAKVDELYGMFVSAVARGRGVAVDQVRSDYGKGRLLFPKAALKVGMVDRIEPFDETIRRLARTSAQRDAAAAAALPDEYRAALGSGLPFAQRLELVSAEVVAIAEHARDRVALRAEEGRELSEATREQLGRIPLALRPVLDDLEAMAAAPIEEPPPEPPRAHPRRLELLIAAAEAGAPLAG